MAYVKSFFAANGSATIALNYSAVENDFMILMHTRKYGSSPSTPSGWTALSYTATSQNGNNNAIWYRRATASEPTSVSVACGTASHDVQMVVISGVDTTTAFDVTPVSRASASTNKGTMPAITPTTAGSLILYLVLPHNVPMVPTPGPIKVARTGSTNGGTIYSYFTYGQGASVAVPAHDFVYDSNTNNNPTMVAIAFRDNGSGLDKGYVYKDSEPATLISLMGQGGRTGHLTGTADINLTSTGTGVITSLDGTTTTYRVGLGRQTNFDSFMPSMSYEATYVAPACQLVCGSRTPSVDLENAIVSFSSAGAPQMYKEYGTLGKHFSLGDGTNFRIWKVDALDTAPSGSEQPIACVIEVDGGFEDSEVGTVSSSVLQALTHTAMGGPGTGAYTGNSVGFLYKLNTMIILGASATFPASMAVGVEEARTSSLRTVSNQIRQSQTQFFCAQSIQVGNGSIATRWDSSGHSIEFPSASSVSDLRVQILVSANKFSFVFYASASCNFNISNCTFNLGNQHTFGFHASFNSSATLNETGALVINATLACNDVGRALAGMSFSGCTENTGDANFSGGNTFSNCTEDQYFTVTSEAEFAKLYNCTFQNNSVRAILITGNQTGTWADPNITTSGNTVDIVYTGTTDFSIQSAKTLTRTNASSGVLTIVTPIETLTINSDVASTLIRYFEDDSQTIVDSTTGTTLDYDYPDSDPIDIELVKQGYVPINRQNVTPFNGDLDIEMDFDESYNASHGLTITSEYDYVRATKVLTINSDQNALDVRSALADVIRTNSSYYNTRLLMVAIPGLTRIDLTNGMTITSMATWKGAGMERFDAADSSNPVEKWFCIKSVGNITGATVHYRQTSSGSSSAITLTNNVVDEAFQYWDDPNHDGSTADGFDYSGYMVIKAFLLGSKQGRVDVVANTGLSALKSNLYTVPLQNVSHGYSGTDPGISADLTLVSGGTVGGKTFTYKWVDGGTNSGSDIADQLNYNAATGPTATIPGGTGLTWFELGDMVVYNATSVETERCLEEGSSPSYVGFYVERGGADHPDFTRFQADDGTYYTPATVAQASAPNLTAGRVQVVNETGRTAAAWASSTAKSLYDKVLRSTGTGSESGIGLYFQCTTPGTTGGTEPTWNTTPGATTNDGTAVWTCRAIEFDNTTITSGYSNSWTDHEDFDSGDTIRLRWTAAGSDEILAFGIATTDGTTTFLDTPSSDTVYAAYGIDGSTVTEYSSDFPNVQVDINDPDNVFYMDRFYAWYKYEITTADGIRNFFGAISATNTSNITIKDSVVDIFFDNVKAVSARQGDNIVIQREDGVYPQVATTSGGGGLGFYYTGIGYSTSSGSGLDSTERAKLLGLYDYNPVTKILENGLTDEQAMRLILASAAGKIEKVSDTEVRLKSQDGLTDRVIATVNADGERTAVTVDGT